MSPRPLSVHGPSDTATADLAPAHFDRLAEEAVALLTEAQHYFSHYIGGGKQHFDADAQIVITRENQRITARLAQVMAWVLAEKAFHSGEITLRHLTSGRYSPPNTSFMTDNCELSEKDFPDTLRILLDKTHGLYLRVLRLDEMVRVKAGAASSLPAQD